MKNFKDLQRPQDNRIHSRTTSSSSTTTPSHKPSSSSSSSQSKQSVSPFAYQSLYQQQQQQQLLQQQQSQSYQVSATHSRSNSINSSNLKQPIVSQQKVNQSSMHAYSHSVSNKPPSFQQQMYPSSLENAQVIKTPISNNSVAPDPTIVAKLLKKSGETQKNNFEESCNSSNNKSIKSWNSKVSHLRDNSSSYISQIQSQINCPQPQQQPFEQPYSYENQNQNFENDHQQMYSQYSQNYNQPQVLQDKGQSRKSSPLRSACNSLSPHSRAPSYSIHSAAQPKQSQQQTQRNKANDSISKAQNSNENNNNNIVKESKISNQYYQQQLPQYQQQQQQQISSQQQQLQQQTSLQQQQQQQLQVGEDKKPISFLNYLILKEISQRNQLNNAEVLQEIPPNKPELSLSTNRGIESQQKTPTHSTKPLLTPTSTSPYGYSHSHKNSAQSQSSQLQQLPNSQIGYQIQSPPTYLQATPLSSHRPTPSQQIQQQSTVSTQKRTSSTLIYNNYLENKGAEYEQQSKSSNSKSTKISSSNSNNNSNNQSAYSKVNSINNSDNSQDNTNQEEVRIVPSCTSKSQFHFHYVIGKGGFGKVWKVEHRKTRQLFAMKEMSKSLVITKKSVNSVMNERELLSQLKHPFLVNIFYAFQDRDNLFLVMDLMPGGDLRYHIGRQRRFSEEQTRFFVACIFLGLEYLHNNNIIHRDIKPENLVLESCGYVRLTDLGIARTWKLDNANDTSGTPGYMAPEVMCRQPHTFAVDYFALGVLAYEFMLGKRPYLGRSRKEIRDQILAKRVQIKKHEIPEGWSIEAADFINRLIERKPANRLGINGPAEVKNHPWIRNYPWQKLMNKQIPAPFIPGKDGNFDQKQQISLEDEQNQELIIQNAMLLRKSSVQSLFNGYNYDSGAQRQPLSSQQSSESQSPQCQSYTNQEQEQKGASNYSIQQPLVLQCTPNPSTSRSNYSQSNNNFVPNSQSSSNNNNNNSFSNNNNNNNNSFLNVNIKNNNPNQNLNSSFQSKSNNNYNNLIQNNNNNGSNKNNSSFVNNNSYQNIYNNSFINYSNQPSANNSGNCKITSCLQPYNKDISSKEINQYYPGNSYIPNDQSLLGGAKHFSHSNQSNSSRMYPKVVDKENYVPSYEESQQ